MLAAQPSAKASLAPKQALTPAIHGLRVLLNQLHVQTLTHRRRTWHTYVQDAWLQKQSRLYRHTKGEVRTTAADLLLWTDGTPTANPAEMDQLLHEAWAPIFRLYAGRPEPDWRAFAQRFGQYI